MVALGRDYKKEEDFDENLLSIMDGQKPQYVEQISEQEFSISKISEKIWDKYPQLSLNEIVYKIHEPDLESELLPNVFKTRMFIVGMQPQNLLEICQLFCKECLSTFSFKEFMDTAGAPDCPKCLKGNSKHFAKVRTHLEPIYFIQFWAKDKSNIQHVNPQKVLLYTCGGAGSDFFNGIQPCNLYLEANAKSKNQIERYIRKLFKFNSVVDAVVSKHALRSQQPLEADTLRFVDCKVVYQQQ